MSREHTLVEKLYAENKKLHGQLAKERRKAQYLVRQIRKYKKELSGENKRNHDPAKQEDAGTRNVQHTHRRSSSPKRAASSKPHLQHTDS